MFKKSDTYLVSSHHPSVVFMEVEKLNDLKHVEIFNISTYLNRNCNLFSEEQKLFLSPSKFRIQTSKIKILILFQKLGKSTSSFTRKISNDTMITSRSYYFSST